MKSGLSRRKFLAAKRRLICGTGKHPALVRRHTRPHRRDVVARAGFASPVESSFVSCQSRDCSSETLYCCISGVAPNASPIRR